MVVIKKTNNYKVQGYSERFDTCEELMTSAHMG